MSTDRELLDRALKALHGAATAVDARHYVAEHQAGKRKLTAPMLASMLAKARTEAQVRDEALEAWEAIVTALHERDGKPGRAG